MRGLSGAVTALILVVASVVIALIVVGYVFNLFGALSSSGAVTPGVPAYLYTTGAPPGITYNGGGYVYLQVTLNNRGPNTTITSATINGQTVRVFQVWLYNGTVGKLLPSNYIPAGQNQLVIVFTGINPSTIAGNPVNIQLSLENGQTVTIAANLVNG